MENQGHHTKSIAAYLALTFLIFLLWPSWAAGATGHVNMRLVEFRRPIPAPDFKVESLSGDKLSLQDFRGKTVLLNFWATWCPPCVKEMPSMEQLYQKFRNQSFSVVAISIDEAGAGIVARFVKRLNLSFPIGLDPNKLVSKAYGTNALPSSFILNSEGQVIAAAKGERDWFSEAAVHYMEMVTPGIPVKTSFLSSGITGGRRVSWEGLMAFGTPQS
ncbi:MAG: redoxin domain-containing protein [SAR324 cluster bacterium]|nr:redoxin domain-containing protein [SAR324 cluster bacterium]